ncbi:MAG: TonB-dependent receptor [Flavobacteriales bacterium]|nr:TonB-dependent receptor [Flavobacteriales bacterium]
MELRLERRRDARPHPRPGRPRAPYYETAFDAAYVTLRLDNAVFAEGRFEHARPHQCLGRTQPVHTHTQHVAARPHHARRGTIRATGHAGHHALQPHQRAGDLRSNKDSAHVLYELGTDPNLETGRVNASDGIPGRSGTMRSSRARSTWRPNETITIRPGARYAYNTRYAAPVIPSLNARWQLAERFTMRASYAEGFRAPSLKELHLFFVDVNHDITGNPDLKAERSRSGSAGISYRHAKDKVVYTSELNGFYNDVRDLITLAQLTAPASPTRTSVACALAAAALARAGTMGIGSCAWAQRSPCPMDAFADENAEPGPVTNELRGSITREWRRLAGAAPSSGNIKVSSPLTRLAWMAVCSAVEPKPFTLRMPRLRSRSGANDWRSPPAARTSSMCRT